MENNGFNNSKNAFKSSAPNDGKDFIINSDGKQAVKIPAFVLGLILTIIGLPSRLIGALILVAALTDVEVFIKNSSGSKGDKGSGHEPNPKADTKYEDYNEYTVE